MQTIRPTMKQTKCKHPSTAILRGVDESKETCTRCGLVRVAHYDSPWLLAVQADEMAQTPPDLVLVSAPVPEMPKRRPRRPRA